MSIAAAAPAPTSIKLHKLSRMLEVGYADGSGFSLPLEYLRVFSPSAEVRGHGGGEPMLVAGKRNVGVSGIDSVGRYAVRLRFDDGHDSGLYSWSVLKELAENHEAWWARYLARMAEHGMSRDSDVVKLSALGVKTFKPVSGGAKP